jgi:hypothetical protein
MVPAIHIYAQPRHVGRNYIVHPARMTTMKILLSHTIENEIHELKNNVDLNKKTFRQLVLGKIGDVVINETGSQVAAILKNSHFGLSDIYTFITGATNKLLG